MDTAVDHTKKDPKATSKDKNLQRKSLNTSVSSKNGHNESAVNRGHVSEVIVCSTADEKSANKSDKVIASLEKHRNTKSNKKSDTNKSLSKNDSAANKSKSKGKAVGRIEAQTCKEGEKWVETSKNVEQIISVDLTSNENQNQPENTNSKAKTRHTSKKKDQKEEQHTEPKSKSKGKSLAKSKGKKSQKKQTGDDKPSSLKRTKMAEKPDLANEETEAVEVKSRKKSSVKSKH